mgnify:CR=1 FL=1
MLRREKLLVTAVITFLVWGLFVVRNAVYHIPEGFPVNTSFSVHENESLRSMSNRLLEEGFVVSPVAFRAMVSFFGKDTRIQIGEYHFDQRETLLGVVRKITSGKPDAPLISVTIPEGSTLEQTAELFREKLPAFSAPLFLKRVAERHLEGKLFPSTYYPLPSFNEDDVIDLMHNTFQTKAERIILNASLPQPLKNVDDVIVLASLVEGEAKTKEDMRVVAGILLKRLIVNMPLQVDVATSTYKTKGLPKKAINSPGLNAITSVLDPVSSEYLYYITGKNGLMYYAKTFLEHRKNILNYLK